MGVRVRVRAGVRAGVRACVPPSLPPPPAHSAWVWGSSVKHHPQKVGIDHQLEDEDVVQIVKRCVPRAPWIARGACALTAVPARDDAVARPDCPAQDRMSAQRCRLIANSPGRRVCARARPGCSCTKRFV